MRVPRFTLIAALVFSAVAFLAIACNGDDEGETSPDADATTTVAAEATEPPEDEPTEAPEPTSQTLDIVMIATLAFDKTELRANAGSEITVRFDNQETAIPHNWAIYTDDSASEAIAGANEQICTAPCTGEVTFGPLDAGTYFFRCDVHPTTMIGEFIVE